MIRTIIITTLVLNVLALAAVKHDRVYSYTPDRPDLTYKEFKVNSDLYSVWHSICL